LNVQCNQQFKHQQFENYSRIFNNAGQQDFFQESRTQGVLVAN